MFNNINKRDVKAALIGAAVALTAAYIIKNRKNILGSIKSIFDKKEEGMPSKTV